MSYVYLASPYSSNDAWVRHNRYEQVCHALSIIAEQSIPTYSPIACWHPIAVNYRLPKDHVFWKKQDESFLLHSTEMWVLQLKGWESSEGVAAEIEFCKQEGLDVHYVKRITALPAFCEERKAVLGV